MMTAPADGQTMPTLLSLAFGTLRGNWPLITRLMSPCRYITVLILPPLLLLITTEDLNEAN
jgi:hypothetical protein